jgi:outer membrane receptor for ferrienterochelin and colicin
MAIWKQFAGGAAVSMLAIAMAQSAYAQETTSNLAGTVSSADGTPATNATVTVTDTRTGTTRTSSTSATGSFDVRNLNPGGPYTVTVSSGTQQPTRLEGVFVNLGAATNVNLQFTGAVSAEVIVVTASAANTVATAIGPSATFTLQDLEEKPSINRDIKDILRLDPRIHLDFAAGGGDGSNGIQCGGQHTRFNSLTVDGVRLSDDFGLNTNGYPTERIPFSYDTINQVSVELAPFDVQYGGFTGCNINAVTKSGSNKFHGGVFFDFTNDSLYGDTTDGIQRNLGSFEEKRYGVNVGGPIIPDTLFFFASYEKLEGANIFGKTPADVGITQAQWDQLISIAENQYGYVSGGLPTSMAVEDEKFFAKIDWNINDRHRAAFTYTYNDGFNFSPSDNSSTQISDGNHYYERGAEAQAYTGALYSDWTDNLSTEFRISYLDLKNRQLPIAGTDFGEVQVNIPRAAGGSVTAYLGADDSRHSNVLSYDTLSYKAAANYRLGAHTLTGGFERSELNVFNLFLAETQGEWRFSSLADFASGAFNYFEYSNSVGSNNPNDSAAQFGYEINTLYAQDEWQVTDQLNVTAGLRYELYTSSDQPRLNQPFVTRYGFANNESLDGKDLIQPRLGVTYDLTNDIQLRGGLGLFSGGNPNVWVSNSYSNDGVSAADFICQNQTSTTAAPRCNFTGLTLANPRAPNLSDFNYGTGGRPFWDVPVQAENYIGGASAAGSVNAIDPDFEIPSVWKLAFGGTWNLDTGLPVVGDDWTLTGDILFSQFEEVAVVEPLGYVTTRRASDGRPIYTGNTNDFVLTNSEKKNYAQVYSGSIHKDHGNGIDWTVGYAYTDSKDVNPMTSSVAFSNFSNYNTYDPLGTAFGTSDYEVAHRFTFNFNYELDWAENWETKLSLFGSSNSGAPYSYTIGSATFGNTSAFEPFSGTRQLAYIPTSAADPVFSPTSNAAALQQLDAFISSHEDLGDYRGRIIPRNTNQDDWYTKFDLKLSQNFPGFMGSDSFQGFVVVENLGNLLNDSWGVQREHGFPGNAVLYGISGLDAQGRPIVSSFNPGVDNDSIVVNASLWNVRVGVKYSF